MYACTRETGGRISRWGVRCQSSPAVYLRPTPTLGVSLGTQNGGYASKHCLILGRP
jgi:hypothetical protein